MTGLSAAAAPTALIPGDPDSVDWLAREYARYAAGACDAARSLRQIDTGAWVGPAGDAFRSAIGEVPTKLERGQQSFARTAAALASYARVLREAQADAAAAARRYADGETATDTWRRQVSAHDTQRAAEVARAAAAGRPVPQDTGQPPSYDPGAEDRTAAEHLLAGARERVEAAARRTTAVVEDARHGAPHEPGLLSKAVDAAGSFFAGAGEATWGLVELSYKLSPFYAIVDPQGFIDNAQGIAGGLVYGVEHPVELGKAIIDYDTWRTDPARALGHLVPDLLLTVATAGAGEGGVAGARAAEGAQAAEELAVRGSGAAARAAGLPEHMAAALEERFGSPMEGALGFQGKPPFPGVDRWQDTILRKGEKLSVGYPGPGHFAASQEAVEEVGTDARRYYEGVQARSQHQADGVNRYRSHLLTFEVKKPLPVAESIAEANPQFGAGGLRQFYVPDEWQRLVDEGYLSPPVITKMDNLEAAIGPKGIRHLPELPEDLPRQVAAVGDTLAPKANADAGANARGCR